jgi:hypothetical protein
VPHSRSAVPSSKAVRSSACAIFNADENGVLSRRGELTARDGGRRASQAFGVLA